MKIRTALPADKAALERLWKDAFGDEGVMKEFFIKRYNPANALVAENDEGVIVSALHAVPCETADREFGVFDALRIEGAATASSERNKGYMSALLDFVMRNAKTGKIVLFPTDRAFFEKRGFVTNSYVLETDAVPDVRVEYTDVERDTAEMNRVYTDTVVTSGGVARDKAAWHFLLKEAQAVCIEQGCCCAYAVIKDGTAIEVAADDELSARAMISKLADMNVKRMCVIPGSFAEKAAKAEKTKIPYGMTYGRGEDDYAYIPDMM